MNITVSFLLWLGLQLGFAPQVCGALDADGEHPICASTEVNNPDDSCDQDSESADGGMQRTVSSAILISNGF